MVTKRKQRNSPPRGLWSGQPNMGNPGLSSTYQSFAETGPTNSYLDLCRARSDESLLWSAGEEAAALVAELRASINSPVPSGSESPDHIPMKDLRPMSMAGRSDNSASSTCTPSFWRNGFAGGSGPTSPSWMSVSSASNTTQRSRSFTDLQSVASSEDLRVFNFNHNSVNYRNPAAHRACNGYYQTGSKPTPGLKMSSCSSEDITDPDTIIPGARPGFCRSYSGSWRSLLKCKLSLFIYN